MTSLSKILRFIILISALFLVSYCQDHEEPGDRQKNMGIEKIRVVMDNNYPPFIFIDSSGKQQGILVEQWKLWELKTGVKVEIIVMDWHEAMETMQKGEADVIDTIFINEERASIYDFTEPYADIDVSVFFNKKISGIKDAETAKGFSLAVKKGDNAINVLKKNGVENLQEFDSYEEIIKLASKERITVFVADTPPAFYYLFKLGIQDKFNHTQPLYSGAFHRAVRKGNIEILELINSGFSKISKKEYEDIDRRWYGTRSIINQKTVLYMATVVACFCAASLFLFAWNRALKKQVGLKTKALAEEMEANLKKTEKLAKNEEILRSTIESMDDLIFIFDKESRFTAFHQPSKKKELLLPPEAFLGKKIEEIGMPGEAVNAYKNALEKLHKSGKPQSYEYTLNIYGETKWYSARLSDRRDSGGNFDGATAVIRDITTQKNLEAERERILANLEIKNIELEKIIFLASHDLRSPLLNIHGFSKRLEKDMDEIHSAIINTDIDELTRDHLKGIIEDRIKNAIGYIISGVGKMDSLINGLLRLSRSGSKEPVKTHINMNNLIANTLASMSMQIEAAGAKVKTENLPACKGDSGQIAQVFSIIIDNALKYRDQNRHIEVFIRGRRENGRVVYSVADTGKGIALSDQKRIWEVFQRVEADGKIQGDGLGLPISKKIIERHGGTITVESIPGQGSSFFISLEASGQDAENIPDTL